MANAKPSLTAVTMRRHLLAALITLAVLLLGTLALTDTVMMRARGHALQEQLAAISPTGNTLLLLCDIGDYDGHRTGCCLFDAQGREVADAGNNDAISPGQEQAVSHWIRTTQLLAGSAQFGTGNIPWVAEPVVWAARPVAHEHGQPDILVAWEHVGAIRSALTPVYLAIIAATLLAFAVSFGLVLHGITRVRRVLDTIAESSGRMAAGDYRIKLAAQPTAELDRVTSAVNCLAENLASTAAHLDAEHARLARLEGMQRQFVADASHELRAPLTSMRITLEAWQDGVLRHDEQPAALTQLIGEMDRLGALVERLLDISRIESGRVTYDRRSLSLSAVARDVVAQYAHPQGPPVTVEISADLPPVYADRDALFSVLRNLLENAQRFTPHDGSVHVWARQEGEMIHLGITDTGCGIAPDFLPGIWDRFARADTMRAQGTAGSGLGLSIVKALIEAMDGDVGAESTPCVSTTVWVRLPIANEAVQGLMG